MMDGGSMSTQLKVLKGVGAILFLGGCVVSASAMNTPNGDPFIGVVGAIVALIGLVVALVL